jgi:hypothetical protein
MAPSNISALQMSGELIIIYPDATAWRWSQGGLLCLPWFILGFQQTYMCQGIPCVLYDCSDTLYSSTYSLFSFPFSFSGRPRGQAKGTSFSRRAKLEGEIDWRILGRPRMRNTTYDSIWKDGRIGFGLICFAFPWCWTNGW